MTVSDSDNSSSESLPLAVLDLSCKRCGLCCIGCLCRYGKKEGKRDTECFSLDKRTCKYLSFDKKGIATCEKIANKDKGAMTMIVGVCRAKELGAYQQFEKELNEFKKEIVGRQNERRRIRL